MGQDREFTADERKFALQTVKQYRDIWEEREKENLKKDVLFKINNSDFDKLYKDHYESQDQQEIEKIIEESVIAENASKNDQGEDEMNDEEKNTLARQVRFKELTKGFWAPDSAKEYAMKMSKLAAEPKKEERVKSATGSARESQDETGDNEIPPYHPLVPEFWKSKCIEFSKLHVIKFPRILQSLMYLLHFHSREDICIRDTNKLSWKKAAAFMSGN